ncbi:MAG TPA: glutaredoxin [Chromatiaceae bacterium]|jgi:glutaredoxin|nr:glutaredoxin [Chromatiaceae bacterium]HIB84586.1 glutaredoxin [Chromatiaceae bacterium]HIN82115.1 glutaredoxin [Chromatiales bacterium]HIO14399.1 glutaredoxin [Chromatiales bacterium]HIO54558.1 glutaredoxin [Chromatiales bacterium]
MLVRAVREGLGRVIIFIDFLTRPKKMQREGGEQGAVEDALRGLSLYQFYACPFCVKTRRALRRLNLPLEIRDAQHDATHRQELLRDGGAIKVPCLRIDEDGGTRWMYESNDIIAYLDHRFGVNVAPTI